MMKSLKQGATAAVWLPQIPSQQLMEKRERLEAIQQVLNSVIVRNNQLEIRLNDVVDEIRLVSDRGEIKKVVQSTSELTAELLPKESYWRAELLLKDGTRIFLNPLLRQTDEKLIARNEVAALIVSRNPGEPTLALVLGIFVMVLGSTGKHLPKANTTGGKYAWLRQPPLTN
jgi:hypothetical protein